jgi:hypothetical protein
MLRILVCICWLITVASMWLPNLLKNQFLKNNERQITKVLVTISAIVTICYAFF